MSDLNLVPTAAAADQRPAPPPEPKPAELEERFPFATEDLLLCFAFLWLPREKC